MRRVRQNSQIAYFGAFEADLDNFEIRKFGLRIRLQTQPFRILAELLRRRGEVVYREDLRNALWGDDTFVEFDHGINTAMQKIRRTLNDSAASPRFIETVPRRGYRFIAPVRYSDHKPLRHNHTGELRGPYGAVARVAALVERGLMFLQRDRGNSAG